MKKFLAIAAVLLSSMSAFPQGTVPGQFMVPVGYCQLSASQLAAAVGLSSCSGGIPTNATMAVLQAETANIRYRDDGTNPTASVGQILLSGNAPILYTGTLTSLKFIAATGSPLLDVSFYH